jgi:Protein of unknown function (DUF3467)
MSASPEGLGGSTRRGFLIGGLGLTAGSIAGWLTARGLPYSSQDGPAPSPSLAAPPSSYTNFARVTSTAEEVIIDFCLNPNPFAIGRQEIKVSQRLVLGFPAAKELFDAMGGALQEHEKAHGPIELDIRKRAKHAI